jgi:hypothetical protein
MIQKNTKQRSQRILYERGEIKIGKVRRSKYCTRKKEEAEEPLKRKESRKVRDTPLLSWNRVVSPLHPSSIPVASSRRIRTSPSSSPVCLRGEDRNPVVGEVCGAGGDGHHRHRRYGQLPARCGAPQLRRRAVLQVLHHLVSGSPRRNSTCPAPVPPLHFCTERLGPPQCPLHSSRAACNA